MGFQNTNENGFHGFGNLALENFSKSLGNMLGVVFKNPVSFVSAASRK